MGLLDNILGGSIEDPRTQATMAMVQGLLGSPKAMGGIANGLLGYGDTMSRAKQAQAVEEMRKMQLQRQQMDMAQAQRLAEQQKQQDAFRNSIPSPQMAGIQGAMAANGGPTNAAAAAIPQVDPNAQFMHGAMRAGLIDPLQYMASQRKDTAPVKLAAGEGLYDNKTFKPLVLNPKEDTTPSAVKEYQFAKSQGYAGTFEQFEIAKKRAGATSLNVNTAKPLLNTVAEGLGKQLDSGLENARAAQSAIQTAHSLKSAIDSGKVISGPGATFRIAGLQIGQTLGIGGKDAAETLANTRQAMQSMAQAELDAAAQMKGQGALTEAERAILRRAAAGDIDSLTGPEIRQLADVSERNARRKIAGHRANVNRLKAMPDAAAIMPFYDLEEPAAYAAPSGSGGVRRYNPQTGRLE